MTVDVTVSGSKPRLIAFVRALENTDRAFLVTNINLGGAGGESSLTLAGQMFLLPELVDPTAQVPTETANGDATVPPSESAPDSGGVGTGDTAGEAGEVAGAEVPAG